MRRGSSEMSHVDNQLPLYDGSVITSQLTASLNSVIDCRAPIVIILISLDCYNESRQYQMYKITNGTLF